MKKIIKMDLKNFLKPGLLYIGLIQLFIFIIVNVEMWIPNRINYIFDYLEIFIMAVSSIALVVLTLLFSAYVVVKSNTSHLGHYELTDGYGLYRFFSSFAIIGLIIINFVIGGLINDLVELKEILEIPLAWYVNSAFFWVPVFALIIVTIAHTYKRRIFRNKEGLMAMIVILIGIYIAGNLFYFDNARQGQAVLMLLFIPVAVMYMSIKERNSKPKIYKILIFGLCLIASVSSAYLLVTSDFDYDIGYTVGDNGETIYEDYESEDYYYNSDITSTTIDSIYGEVLVFEDQESNQKAYTLRTENYLYKMFSYGFEAYDIQAYQLNGSTQYSAYFNENANYVEIYATIYDTETGTRTECSQSSSESTDDSCIIDPEVKEVFEYSVEFIDN